MRRNGRRRVAAMGGFSLATTLTWGWALYVVVPFLLFVVGLVGVLAAVRKPWS